jgi:hypothetical protein
MYTSCFCLFQYLRVKTILTTFHILILFGTNKWAYSVICQFWKVDEHNVQNEDSLPGELDRKNWKSFIQSAWNLQLYFFFFTLPLQGAWSKQRPLSCWSWHGRNDFRLLINRTWKLLAKVFKWSPIVCLLILIVMKNPEKYKCGSLWLKYPNEGDSIYYLLFIKQYI